MDDDRRDTFLTYIKLRAPFLEKESHDCFSFADAEFRLRVTNERTLANSSHCRLETLSGETVLEGTVRDVLQRTGVRIPYSRQLESDDAWHIMIVKFKRVSL